MTNEGSSPTISLGSLEIFKGVMDNLVEGVYVVDMERRIVYWNEGAAKITGYSRNQVLGYRCGRDLLAHTDPQGILMCDRDCPLERALRDGIHTECESMMQNNGGYPVPVLVEVMPIRSRQGRIVGAAQIFRDHTRFRETADRLMQMKRVAMEDPVTHLGNRRRVETVLQARIREFERYGLSMGVIFADINNFKLINDTFGHDVGDRVLEDVATAFRQTVRRIDTVGRWGGDEFVCVVPHTDGEELDVLSERLRINVRRLQIDLDEHRRIRPSLSIGTATIRPGDTTDSLIARADLAMYENKRLVKAACYVRINNHE